MPQLEETLEAQTQHWLAHIAFGISTGLGRRFFRSMLENDSDAREHQVHTVEAARSAQ